VDVLALKPAEDGNGYILRLAENNGIAACVHIDLPLLGRELDVQLSAWEIRTLYLPKEAEKDAYEVLITEY